MLLFYPNISNGNVMVNFETSNLIGEKIILFYNLLGQNIYNIITTSEQVAINPSGQSSGIYLYNISIGKNIIKNGKIIIH